MFAHLELNVFRWDGSSFASAGVPGLSRDQDSHLLVAQHVATALAGVCVPASDLDRSTASSASPQLRVLQCFPIGVFVFSY